MKHLNQESTHAMKLKMAPPTKEEQLKKKEEMALWAKTVLTDPNTLIVDVETTGLPSRDPKTEVVSIAMINNEGRVVLAGLVNPGRPIPAEARKVHGIEDHMVKDAPPFKVIGNLIAGTMEGKRVVCYNAGFDVHLLVTLFQRYGIDIPEFEAECAMEAYSAFVGDWTKSKEDYKWQKLPKLAYGKAHDALVDCESTRLLLQKMTGDFSNDPNPNDIDLTF